MHKLSLFHGRWSDSIAYSFPGGSSGPDPLDRLISDQTGNLYSATFAGGAHGNGVVHQLTLAGWLEGRVLYSFQTSDGSLPFGGLVFDPSGNISGILSVVGPRDVGTVFELTPGIGGWLGPCSIASTGPTEFPVLPRLYLVTRPGTYTKRPSEATSPTVLAVMDAATSSS